MDMTIREHGEQIKINNVIGLSREYLEVDGGGESKLEVTYLEEGFRKITDTYNNAIVEEIQLTHEEKEVYNLF